MDVNEHAFVSGLSNHSSGVMQSCFPLLPFLQGVAPDAKEWGLQP